MPQRKSALKALRQNKKKRLSNLKIKTDLKKTIKRFQKLINQKNFAEAESALKDVFSRLDKTAKKKIIHKKTAWRRKSRLRLQLKTAKLNNK